MSTSKVKYLGNLRTESTHLQSGATILTDAPTDNHGRGKAFSPTDMLANSLATCMLTVMGIKAETLGVDFTGATADVTKIMGTEPRRVTGIKVVLNMGIAADEKTKTILERTAFTCPVHFSLHPKIEKDITINWL
ncbi:OsmC family protein [Flavobacterium agricola]|uniref:OsmC family protein n=1 Tax=Flavobacterium agricola TaxID=2870839 RepID=A0ABY6M3N2_9FLAO|nr:OsmC family protein [Flavobacterium agricola]UYW02517.1 OsmC family protein [Flavobacterium agricola]